MVLRLFGHRFSGCTKRAALILHEKNVPFEFVSIDLTKGEHKAPSYTEKQPFGQVPYLVSTSAALCVKRGITHFTLICCWTLLS